MSDVKLGCLVLLGILMFCVGAWAALITRMMPVINAIQG